MSYGVQLFNPKGKLVFDSNETTWNFLGYFVAPADGTATLDVPAAALVNSILIQTSYLDAPLSRQETYVHNVTWNENNWRFRATGGTVRTAIFILGR